MIFQTLDYKKKCTNIYVNNKIYDEVPEGLTGTWSYNSSIPDVDCANLYCGGQTIDSVCPLELENQWKASNDKMKAFMNSFIQSKIDLNQHCFYDLVPGHFLLEFYEIKNKITEHVFENYKKPENYDFLLELAKKAEEIKNQPLNINVLKLNDKKHEFVARNFLKKIKKTEPYIKYNIFGTKTGRLTTKPNSFPILTLKKEYRSILRPNNDLFVELDYNAAELRVLLTLMNMEQPKEDIHAWNAKNIFRGLVTRKEAKERIFAWLYNPDSKDHLANRAYDKANIKEKYWDGKIVKTPFGREIKADEFHALNYLIQSTTADLVLRQMIKVADLLKNVKSHVAFVIHDSIVIDFAKEDKGLISEINEAFKQNRFGEYRTSVSIGKNFGDMREVKCT